MKTTKLTILVPVFNEEQVVPLFFQRMQPVIQQLQATHEIALTFINNASTDNTFSVVKALCEVHPHVFLISLAKNVGYQRSIECGLRSSEGDLFAFIDVDCEDPPEMILQFIEAQKQGYDVVYGERVDRQEPEYLKFLRKVFYRVTHAVADDEIILDMAEFSLMTAEVRNAVIQDNNSFPFIRASIGRVGFRRLGIPYTREKRIGGQTHYNLLGMTKFAIAGILSSSTLFLRIPIYLLAPWCLTLAILSIAAAASKATWILPLLLLVAFSYIGFVLSFIAIYVARIYKNTMGRPNAVISRQHTIMQKPSQETPSPVRADRISNI